MSRKWGAAIVSVLAVAFSLTTGTSRAASPEPIAVVTQVRGDVLLMRAGKSVPEKVRTTVFLRAGDVLKAASGGGALVYQVYAPIVRILAGQQRKINPVRLAARNGALTAEEFASIRVQYAAAVRRVSSPSAGRRSGPNAVRFVALSPRHSLILTPRPALTWTSVTGATGYQVRLLDESGQAVWETFAAESHLAYPADQPPLAPGKYQWEVVAQGTTQAMQDLAPFTVATPEESAAARRDTERAARLVPDSKAINLPYIAACLKHRLYPEAETALQQALKQAPKDAALLTLLADVYRATERWDEREKVRATMTARR